MLSISAEQLAVLERFVIDGYPVEVCGLLVGTTTSALVRVDYLVQTRNVTPERSRYVVDPSDLIAARVAAQTSGLDIVGVWHSHPDHAAFPSQCDRLNAWPAWSYLIAAVTAQGVKAIRSFRFSRSQQPVEEQICQHGAPGHGPR